MPPIILFSGDYKHGFFQIRLHTTIAGGVFFCHAGGLNGAKPFSSRCRHIYEQVGKNVLHVFVQLAECVGGVGVGFGTFKVSTRP